MPSPPDLAQLAAARDSLAQADPVLARVHASCPPFEWRTSPGGYAGLLRIMVGQQVSLGAAAAIWRRLEDGLGGEVTAEGLLTVGPDRLRAFGFSGAKTVAATAIARAQVEGTVNLDALADLADDQASKRLLSLPGVGLWTAETYLMFCEGRRDVFPAGDVALREAMRWLDNLPLRPDVGQAYERSRIWAPHRGVAAHLLWRWYGGVKRGEIVLEAG